MPIEQHDPGLTRIAAAGQEVEELASGFGNDQGPAAKRATTSFTSVGNAAGLPEPILKPSPAPGYDAETLSA